MAQARSSNGEGAGMPGSLDELPGIVQLISVVGFLATLAAITQVPRHWGYQALWENIQLVGPVWGLVWFSGTLLVGRRWVSDGRSRSPDRSGHRRALQRIRRRVAWWCVRFALGASLLAFTVFAMVVGEQVSDDDQELIETAPRHTATIVKMHQDPLSRGGPDITVEVDGRTVVLFSEYPGANDAAIGDTLEVVIDPDDPEEVIATTAHDDWVYTPMGSIALYIGLGVVALAICVPMMLVPGPRELLAAWSSCTVHDGTVLEVDEGVVTLDASDGLWTWRPVDEWAPPAGQPVSVIGEIRPGGLVLLDDGRTRWPSARLQQARTAGPV